MEIIHEQIFSKNISITSISYFILSLENLQLLQISLQILQFYKNRVQLQLQKKKKKKKKKKK